MPVVPHVPDTLVVAEATRVGVVIVGQINLGGRVHLLDIGEGRSLLCRHFGLGEDGEENRRENGENGDDDEQLDQRERG